MNDIINNTSHAVTINHNFTATRKQIQINTMCVCISLSAYVTLFCLFSPKLSIILLHPDKNVRKLTMNSAAHKRPFKAASSLASQEGRQYTTTGQYDSRTGNQTEAPSAGPVSSTSNVLQLGEFPFLHLLSKLELRRSSIERAAN